MRVSAVGATAAELPPRLFHRGVSTIVWRLPTELDTPVSGFPLGVCVTMVRPSKKLVSSVFIVALLALTLSCSGSDPLSNGTYEVRFNLTTSNPGSVDYPCVVANFGAIEFLPLDPDAAAALGNGAIRDGRVCALPRCGEELFAPYASQLPGRSRPVRGVSSGGGDMPRRGVRGAPLAPRGSPHDPSVPGVSIPAQEHSGVGGEEGRGLSTQRRRRDDQVGDLASACQGDAHPAGRRHSPLVQRAGVVGVEVGVPV